MTRLLRRLRTLATAVIPVGLAALGGQGALAAAIVIIVMVMALCWIVASPTRSANLAAVLTAARRSPREQPPDPTQPSARHRWPWAR